MAGQWAPGRDPQRRLWTQTAVEGNADGSMQARLQAGGGL